MADKGFVIQDLLTPLGCSVVMLSFLSSKQQFSKGELQDIKKKKKTFECMLKGPLGESRNFISINYGRQYQPDMNSVMSNYKLSRTFIL